MKVGDKFKGDLNNKYDNLYKPFKSYVINQEGVIISTHPTPIKAINYRNKVNPNYKLHFSKTKSMKTIKISESCFNNLEQFRHGVIKNEQGNIKLTSNEVGEFIKLVHNDYFLIGKVSQNIPPHVNTLEAYDIARNEEQRQALEEIGKDFKQSIVIETTTEADPKQFPFVLYTSRY